MTEEHRHLENGQEKRCSDKTQENQEEFDYSKVSDEIDDIVDYLEQLSEEVTKMRVECAVANIELVSAIDNADFEKKMEAVEKLYEKYLQQQKDSKENNSKC
ncbi:hypothetical protein JTE90_008433 [Oedothorax gibbosus]|uniref:Uncharacterized protein n=1 Tax=Oedothorax gibbosus TaxID=931172 RepID=A0AAV6UW93_9ARAC|nr:hypothetical protein JTE90_008433 [Oedothorax gibbosus]